MGATGAERFHAAVVAELDAERAAVLERVTRRLEQARARAETLGAALDTAPVVDPQLVIEHRQSLAEADHWRWVLCVQREAIGLYDHRWVDAVYPGIRRR